MYISFFLRLKLLSTNNVNNGTAKMTNMCMHNTVIKKKLNAFSFVLLLNSKICRLGYCKMRKINLENKYIWLNLVLHALFEKFRIRHSSFDLVRKLNSLFSFIHKDIYIHIMYILYNCTFINKSKICLFSYQ